MIAFHFISWLLVIFKNNGFTFAAVRAKTILIILIGNLTILMTILATILSRFFR